MFRLLCLSWFLGMANGLQAQNRPGQFEFRHIQEEQGLSSNAITSFYHDRDGFLWVGTHDGLNRYDGSHFITFRSNKKDPAALLHNSIYDLCEDQQGNIWAATEVGVSSYNKTTGRFRNIKSVQGRRLGWCTNVLCDRNGDIWFASYYAGLYRCVVKTGQIQFFPFDPRDTPQTISSRISLQSLIEDPDHRGLWVGDKKQGLQYFDITRQRFGPSPGKHPQLDAYKQHYVTALALDDHRLIFGDATDERVVVYDLQRGQLIKAFPLVSKKGRDPFDLPAIFADRAHNLWISSSSYLMFFAEADTYRVTEFFHDDASPYSVAGSVFFTAWQHPDGSVWLGTVNGISITNLERSFYTTHNLAQQFPALTDHYGITSFLESADGSWWLGTSRQDLLHYFPKTGQLETYKQRNQTALHPIGLIFNYGGLLYLGMETGLTTFDPRTKQYTTIPTPDSLWADIPKIGHMTLRHDQIWLSGASKQVWCYTIPTGQWHRYPIASASTDPKFRVRFSLVDHRGDLWLEVYPAGLFRFSKAKNQFINDQPAMSEDYSLTLTSFNQDKQGYFWMTSIGQGLVRYDPRRKQYTYWNESDGLNSDRIWAGLPDQRGSIWIAAYNKFSVYSPRDDSFFNFRVPFNQADPEYVNYLFPMRNGHLLAAMKGYLLEFAPEKLARAPVSKTSGVLINEVTTSDTTYFIHGGVRELRIGADKKDFTVHFAALVTPEHSMIRYKYQLEGFDTSPKVSSQTFAVYNKMPGGDYRFIVSGVMPDGTNTVVSNLTIHIDSHLYETKWFWGSIGLILLGLLLGFMWYRSDQTNQLHQLQVQATRLERDKTEIQYQNLINHLNPHFLFNSLTSLNSLIMANPREASKFLRKLSIIYRYILQNKDKELVTLGDELTFVQNYIDLQQSRFGTDLQITVDVAPDYLARLIVPVTIQNLLENAIKHNTMDEESPLQIRICTADNTLIVVNNLQRKVFVETSNKQGLASLRSLYHYLSRREIDITETDTHFMVSVPLL
ncbi:sensor histidine kinase [Fibrisoma limi]|uniref:sensor histidine kinase n=1 Tax=Fibrisoma limi TaxID=663275 RepID=UPI000320BCC4|nr:sensor histidine kinase [Fibrisoma limi]